MMSKERFRREKDFQAALAIAKSLLNRSLITSSEYRRLKAALIKKDCPLTRPPRAGPAGGKRNRQSRNG
jgi:hypothetical protein